MTMKFVYALDGPHLYGDSLERARWGISANLSGDFVAQLLEEKRTQRFEKMLESGADMLLKQSKIPEFKSRGLKRYHLFFRGTPLLQVVQVPGNACDLAIDESGLGSLGYENAFKGHFMGYMCHNVDTFNQAAFLGILFTNWANIARDCFYSK